MSSEKSVAAWQQNHEKKIFQFTARAIINGTLFRNNPRLLQNKARLLHNNPGLFGNTLGVIYFSFGEKYFLSDEKYFPSTVTRSYFGCSTYCLGESANTPTSLANVYMPTRCHPLIDMNTEPRCFQRNTEDFCRKTFIFRKLFVTL